VTDYTAPAAKVFTVAHIAGGDGRTVCGIEMEPGDLWQPVEVREGDRVHRACEQPEPGEAEQGALL
jgi:hypothetical protein